MLEVGDNADVDYWWNDYGVGGPEVGGYQAKCYPHDSANATFPNGPPSFGHCMRCYLDENEGKPQLWNAYIRVSRKEQRDQRGMVLGIYGGLGHHRYPAVGSGDVFESFKSLAFEVYLTFTAANVATEWNHDLGGFMPGPDSELHNDTWKHNPEIYLRWLQAGVFQPIFRTHMCSGGDPRPWSYPNFPLLRDAFLLRNSLVPYLYTASFKAYQHGVLPIHPLYYEWPEEELSYSLSLLTSYPDQHQPRPPRSSRQPLEYMFGEDFVVAPILEFSDPTTHKLEWPVWVPPGSWMDWWTGTRVSGPAWYNRTYSLSETPLLARAGAVIPMRTYESQKQVVADPLVLVVVWSKEGEGLGELYEDGGSDLVYRDGMYFFFWLAMNLLFL
jgi:alpha-glucosidase (family GH31 glycosyl hydrolase)